MRPVKFLVQVSIVAQIKSAYFRACSHCLENLYRMVEEEEKSGREGWGGGGGAKLEHEYKKD